MQFEIGQIIQHRTEGFRGVIFDADAECMRSDEWYEHMTSSKAPKQGVWYHILVHNGVQAVYAAESDLQPIETSTQVNHPAVKDHFTCFDGQRYATY